jgi:hypothetical protein
MLVCFINGDRRMCKTNCENHTKNITCTVLMIYLEETCYKGIVKSRHYSDNFKSFQKVKTLK